MEATGKIAIKGQTPGERKQKIFNRKKEGKGEETRYISNTK
jgi:hypothetical protein